MTLQFSTILLVLFTFASWTAAQSMNASSLSLPIVDLGYELHRASYYNVSPVRLIVAHILVEAMDVNTLYLYYHLFGVPKVDISPGDRQFLQLFKRPLCSSPCWAPSHFSSAGTDRRPGHRTDWQSTTRLSSSAPELVWPARNCDVRIFVRHQRFLDKPHR